MSNMNVQWDLVVETRQGNFPSDKGRLVSIEFKQGGNYALIGGGGKFSFEEPTVIFMGQKNNGFYITEPHLVPMRDLKLANNWMLNGKTGNFPDVDNGKDVTLFNISRFLFADGSELKAEGDILNVNLQIVAVRPAKMRTLAPAASLTTTAG